MDEHAKTIGLGVLLFSIILMSRSINGTDTTSVPTLNERIVISSIARVLTPAAQNVSPKTFTATPQIPEFPVAAREPASAPTELETSDSTLPTSDMNTSISAVAGTVLGLDSDTVLWERRVFQRHPLASLTKLMTAVVALENIGADKVITMTDGDILADGDAGDFKNGEIFTVRDLTATMLLASSNDAADALARFYGVKPFVDAMQQKAAAYGLTNTSFFDPSGLSPLNQSTANDLGKLARAIRAEHPEIFTLSAQKEFAIVERNSGTSRVIKSINAFSGQPDFLGGKTGYTPEAHGNLISLFRANDSTLLIIVLGTDDRFGETKLLYDWARNAHP